MRKLNAILIFTFLCTSFITVAQNNNSSLFEDDIYFDENTDTDLYGSDYYNEKYSSDYYDDDDYYDDSYYDEDYSYSDRIYRFHRNSNFDFYSGLPH